jgi:hypothetical protein
MLEGSQLRLLNNIPLLSVYVPFCRLSLTRESFVLATVREWNSLNLSVHNIDTLSKFKKAISSTISMPILRHYSYGPRKLLSVDLHQY